MTQQVHNPAQIPQDVVDQVPAGVLPGQGQEQQQQKVSVTLGDVASLVQLIDVVSRRGAVSGGEMAGVGMLRNKLEAFLAQNGALTEQGQFKQDAAQNDAGVETDAPAGELGGLVQP